MRGWLTGVSCLIATAALAACGGGGGGAGTIPADSAPNSGAGAVPSSMSSHTVYLTSNGQSSSLGIPPSIFAYDSSATGTEQPVQTITNASALGITGVATDAQGNVYASYATSNSGPITYSEIVEYSPGGSAIRTIAGDKTSLQTIVNISVAADGTIYVLENAAQVGCPALPHLLAFAATSNGNVAPERDITGANTRLSPGGALAVGPDGTAYVSDIVSNQVGHTVGKIDVYGPSQTGDVPPEAVIQGSNTQLGLVYSMGASSKGLDVDTRIDSTQEQGTILRFALNSNGNVSPAKVINVPVIGFSLAVDSGGDDYMYSGATNGVEIFAADASGTASPIASFKPTIPAFNGCNTCGFTGPMAVH